MEALKVGDEIVWYQQRKWGGKQSVTARYLGARGQASCRIQLDNSERTVKLTSVVPVFRQLDPDSPIALITARGDRYGKNES